VCSSDLAPDAEELLDWVRTRPLAHCEAGALFVHAGLPPQWSVPQALACADELQARLRAPDYRDFLAVMYGNTPALWDDTLAGDERLRCIVNALTRLRYVHADGRMELKPTVPPSQAPAGLLPWFDHPQRASRPAAGGLPVVFGHWSSLGLMLRDDALALDTGCVWGGQLTALSWPARQVWQVQCPGGQDLD
jgi:bis(5'-nucleosyl)-tetraphosphatase (symmetrical)